MNQSSWNSIFVCVVLLICVVHAGRSYYDILVSIVLEPTFILTSYQGVPKDAPPNKIKSAFRALSLKYHPDKNKEPGSVVMLCNDEVQSIYCLLDAEKKFLEVSEAYQSTFPPPPL